MYYAIAAKELDIRVSGEVFLAWLAMQRMWQD
jgi:hypothetical protein